MEGRKGRWKGASIISKPILEGSQLMDYDRDEMMGMLKKHNIPYVEVQVHGDGIGREESPIGHLADAMEMLVNSLLGDIVMTASSDAGHILAYLQGELENLAKLSSLIMNDTQRLRRLKDNMDKMLKEHRKHVEEEGEERKTEVPAAFLEIFQGEEEGKKGEEGEKEEEEEAGEAIVNNFTNEEVEGEGKEEEEGREEGPMEGEEPGEEGRGSDGREEGMEGDNGRGS